MRLEAPKLLERLLRGEHLDEATASELLRELARGELPPALAGALLAALRAKGETAAEIRGFARAMRELALRPNIPPGAYVDIVGTGGDGSGSLNLSTGASLLAAACGLPVVKHGNRSVSSKSGSADVLAALGLPIPLDEAAAGACLARCGFTFLFAPHYHAATKAIGPVRQALGVRTVFNILGPLANPAAPPYHVIGAFSDAMAASMAETLAGLPLTRAFVVHGEAGWDEATPAGPFVCYDVRPNRVERAIRDPRDAGVERCTLDDLRGGDAAHNAARLREALAGRDTPAHRDALALNAALALEVTGTEPDARGAVARACSARKRRRHAAARAHRGVREGARRMTFLTRMAEASRARVHAARAKESEAALERRALAAPPAPQLVLDRFDVVAELKLRSPAAGGLARADFDADAQLEAYARGGAAAVSVLTEPTEFRGELAHLAAAARTLGARRPVMRKDFLTEPYQVLEARAAGAGGVLVILAMLADAEVRALVDCARRCGLFVLLEAFDRADLERLEAYDTPATPGPQLLAGVNCRDLRDLQVRFERFAELGAHLPRHLPVVAESGIGTVADVEAVVAAGYRAALVGSSLMKAAEPAAALAGFIAAGRAATAGRQARCS